MEEQDCRPNAEIILDDEDRLISFSWHMAFCPYPTHISSSVLNALASRDVNEILNLTTDDIMPSDKLTDNAASDDEEKRFLVQNELNIIKSILAKYIAVEREDIDTERCAIVSVHNEHDRLIIQALILPPDIIK